MGQQTLLKVKRHGDDRVEREAYLKFDVRGLAGPVRQARLRLFLEAGPPQQVSDAVHAVSDTGWTEQTLTWTARPATGAQLAGVRLTELGRHFEWDVTAHVNALLGRVDAIAFSVRAVDLSNDIREYSSKESPFPDRRPHLAIER
jgi:hypothetical protein